MRVAGSNDKRGYGKAVDLIIGFIGWFIIHSIYWGPILMMADDMDEAAIVLLFCFFVPLPFNIIALILLRRRRRWVMHGILGAIVVNSFGVIFFTPLQTAWWTIITMIPFYLYSLGKLT